MTHQGWDTAEVLCLLDASPLPIPSLTSTLLFMSLFPSPSLPFPFFVSLLSSLSPLPVLVLSHALFSVPLACLVPLRCPVLFFSPSLPSTLLLPLYTATSALSHNKLTTLHQFCPSLPLFPGLNLLASGKRGGGGG